MAVIHRNQGVKQIVIKLKLDTFYGNKEKEKVLAKYKYLLATNESENPIFLVTPKTIAIN
jgi:hypothetical protein